MRITEPLAKEDGFTLIEVVIAVVLIAFVMVSAAGLFVRGIQSSVGIQRRQAGIALGDQALELVHGVDPTAGTLAASPLVAGLTEQNPVAADWRARTGLTATDLTFAMWSLPGHRSGEPYASTVQKTVSGAQYTVDTYIGACYLPARDMPDTTCTKDGNADNAMIRVVAVVGWSGRGTHQCTGGSCTYTASTLIDWHTDPQFNSNTKSSP